MGNQWARQSAIHCLIHVPMKSASQEALFMSILPTCWRKISSQGWTVKGKGMSSSQSLFGIEETGTRSARMMGISICRTETNTSHSHGKLQGQSHPSGPQPTVHRQPPATTNHILGQERSMLVLCERHRHAGFFFLGEDIPTHSISRL